MHYVTDTTVPDRVSLESTAVRSPHIRPRRPHTAPAPFTCTQSNGRERNMPCRCSLVWRRMHRAPKSKQPYTTREANKHLELLQLRFLCHTAALGTRNLATSTRTRRTLIACAEELVVHRLHETDDRSKRELRKLDIDPLLHGTHSEQGLREGKGNADGGRAEY